MELEVAITEQVKQTLKLADQDIPAEASLIEFGLHSLAIMQLVNGFQETYELELNYVDFASMPTIRDWVSLLESGSSQEATQDDEVAEEQSGLVPVEGLVKKALLSEMQYSYWVGQQSTEVAAHLYVEFAGQDIDPTRLNAAIRTLFQIHPMLRVTLLETGEQEIGALDENYQLHIDDLRELSEEDIAPFLAEKREQLAHQKLLPEDGRLIDFSLTLLPEQQHRLHIDVNMIAADALSILQVYKDLALLYADDKQALILSDISYFDYLQQAEQDIALRRAAERDKAWWQSRLADIAPPPKLPLVPEQFRVDGHKSTSIHHVFSATEKQALEALAQQHKVSLSTLMLAVFSVVVGNWSSSNRFRLNLPMFSRQPYGKRVDHLVGDFTNLLIFSVELFEDEAFGKMLQRFEAERQEGIQHSAYSGMNVLRDLSRLHEATEVAPIVYTCGLEHGEVIPASVEDALGKATWCISQGPMVDMDIQLAQYGDGIFVNWDVRTSAFKEGVIDAMFDAYLSLVQGLVHAPTPSQQAELPLRPQLPLVQRQMRKFATPSLLGNTALESHTASLHNQFWQQVEQTPANIALMLANNGAVEKTLSYQQLAQQVTKAAAQLGKKGVISGASVAIDLSEREAHLVAVLATLTVGATLALLDEASSDETRLVDGKCDYLIKDGLITDTANSKTKLTVINYADLLAGATPKKLAQAETVPAQQVAYLINDVTPHTHIAVTHQAAVASVTDIIKTFGFNPTTRLLSLHAQTSKVSLLDMFATLLSGGTLVLVDQLTKSTPQQWGGLIQQQKINTLHCPALQLNTLVQQAETDALASLALTLSGGRATNTQAWQALRQHNKTAQLVSLGEAQHTTFYAGFTVCDDQKAQQSTYLTYGRPLSNVGFKIINEQGHHCPDFVVGQLWVSEINSEANSGSNGFEATGEHLATHYENKGMDWYNTGDFAYYLPNGEIQLCEMAEQSLSPQGAVIDLQRINTLICECDGVLDAAVQTVQHEGKEQLVAGVVVDKQAPQTFTPQQIQQRLAEVLPRHLLPSHYWLAETLPLDNNGRLDGQALLANSLQQAQQALNQQGNSQQMSGSALQQAIQFIVAKTIGVEVGNTSPEDDFFDNGGDSLLATHLTATINQYFKGCDLTIVDVFVERTPANLALKINEKLPNVAEKIAEVLLKVIRKQA